MKLLVGPGRPGELKVLASAELTGLRPEVEVVSSQQERVVPFLAGAPLPALLLPSGTFLFSTNAICQYFFTLSGKPALDATNQWLEWEVTQLRPAAYAALHTAVLQGRKGGDCVAALRDQLAHLNQALIDQAAPCLTSDTVTVADIVVWGTLYPLLQDATELPADEYGAVREWVQRIGNLAACRKAASAVFEGRGVQVFKLFLQKQPAPAPLPEAAGGGRKEVGERAAASGFGPSPRPLSSPPTSSPAPGTCGGGYSAPSSSSPWRR
ncbi:methionine--tRNA ligase, cytoplasmic [Scyliorhinus canicula]|uniref:methionine--tRNA ligase, cytoplasmic n=1 Tax=Scyliorhinus canicula TaxID=7830 RepID=UPI0018F57489|nr:methionine--tRNA ligase, cytoplasmic [Scyliorhinus canicula]